MPATKKSDLLAINGKEFSKLKALIAPVSEQQALVKDSQDNSIKDVIAHRAHWIDLFLGWYANGQAGIPLYFPAKGYKWNELPRYNADLRQQQTTFGWHASVNLLEEGYDKLTRFIEALSDDELYGGAMKGAKNNWTPGRWAEAAGPSHFRSASKYIRARLRSM